MTAPDTIDLAAGVGRVAIAPQVGGAVAGFSVDGVDVLRPASPRALGRGDVLAFASYPLIPYSNRIGHASLRAGGTTFALARNFGAHPHAIHGVGWQRAWQVAWRDDRSLALELAHRPAGGDAAAWPFAFRARQAFALAADGSRVALTMTLGITSEDDRAFPFGLGFHPFFARRPGTTLALGAQAVWQTDATGLPTRLDPVPEAWRFDVPREVRDVALDHAFAGWDGRADVGWPRERLRVHIEADRALSHVVVYVPREDDAFALEPVTHMTDAFNRAAAGEPGTGTRTLRPGQSFSCTMRITVTP